MVAVLIGAVLAIGFIRFNFTHGGDLLPGVTVIDPAQGTFQVRGVRHTLNSGVTEDGALRLFGLPVYGDLDGDGDRDAAVLLEYVHDSDREYHGALVFDDAGVMRSSGSLYLGLGAVPQTIEIREGRAVYNYILGGDGTFENPSRAKSLWVHYDSRTNEIGEWVRDFEGESR